MLTTEREETTLYDGREWRTHYWQIRKEAILRYAHHEKQTTRSVMFDDRRPLSPIGDISDDAVYDQLDEDLWTTRKLPE